MQVQRICAYMTQRIISNSSSSNVFSSEVEWVCVCAHELRLKWTHVFGICDDHDNFSDHNDDGAWISSTNSYSRSILDIRDNITPYNTIWLIYCILKGS